MAVSLPDYKEFNPTDTPEDQANWESWLEGFESMVGAMSIEDDAPAVPATDEAEAVPAKVQWFKLLMYYIGNDTRSIPKPQHTLPTQ